VRVSEKKNAWGTLQYPVDSPNQALQLAQGGAGRLRNLAVDLATLEQLGAPHAVDAPPNLVHLGPPGDLSSWRPWFRWLDAAAVVGPAGPLTWVPVPARDQLTAAEVDAKLRRGSAVAGTGERLWLRVDGLHPGDAHLPIVDTASLAPTGPTADTGTALTTPSAEPLLLTVDAITSGLDRVRILGDGGRVLYDAPEPPEAWAVPADAGRWVLALGTGPGEAWAVTGPIWIAPPR